MESWWERQETCSVSNAIFHTWGMILFRWYSCNWFIGWLYSDRYWAEKIKDEIEAFVDFRNVVKVHARDEKFTVEDWIEAKRQDLFIVCAIAETDAEVTAAQEEPVSQLRSWKIPLLSPYAWKSMRALFIKDIWNCNRCFNITSL